jgi:hypothetical protein
VKLHKRCKCRDRDTTALSAKNPAIACISELGDHLFEGRYSHVWPDGKKHAKNVYAHTREECEEKLKKLIVQMKKEIAETRAKTKEK